MRIAILTSCLVALLAGLPAGAEEAAEEAKEQPSGRVTIGAYQASFIGSGQLGGGQLTFRGETHDFKIGGLGFGGIGIARIDAEGDVFGLEKLEDFAGTYGQLRGGIGVTDKSIGGPLWVENTKGVRLKLETKMSGVILNLGADGLVIVMDDEEEEASEDE
ncbi:MAG: hypothetical protein ACQGVC_14850 [Myxococcota bacterium]